MFYLNKEEVKNVYGGVAPVVYFALAHAVAAGLAFYNSK